MAWPTPYVLFNERNEEMKRVLGILVMAALSVSGMASVAFAQQPQPPAPEGGIVVHQERMLQGPEGAPLPPPRDFFFVATEGFGGKTVKNAPYSAESITETVQTLADGNRIVNKITSQVYRDSEGRTRREQTLKGLGPIGSGEEPLQTIFINDPVAGVTYSLDTRTKIAHKSAPFKFEFTPKPGAAGEAQQFEFKTAPPGAGARTNVIVTAQSGAPAPAGTRVGPPPEGGEFTLRAAEGAATYVFRTRTGADDNQVKEQLGKQMIEGVEAEGTRTTLTIPAGEIGNERAIEIVTERWYSPELQLVVMTKHSDPRNGETTYKLTNINRSEPAKSLFEVPPGFTVKEMQMGPPMAAPTRMKKLANPE
jgi:hypothetical protein